MRLIRATLCLIVFWQLTACEDVLLGTRDGQPPQRIDAGRVEADAGGEIDAGEEADAGSALDAAEKDAGSDDSGTIDGGVAPMPCAFETLGPEDRSRIVIAGFGFTAMPNVDGTEIGALQFGLSGTLVDLMSRADVGTRPLRVEFVPSGEIAMVLGEDMQLVSVRVASDGTLTVIDRVQLPMAGASDLRLINNGRTAITVGTDVAELSGLSTVDIACDGTLQVDQAAFFNIRLADSIAFLPGEQRAVLLGGQTAFEPFDNNDVRLLDRSNGRFSEVAPFDLWGDFVSTGRIALSPDGRTLIMPNGSAFSNEGAQAIVAEIDQNMVVERTRIMNLEDASEAIFSPDGQTALITLFQPGHVVIATDGANGWQERSRIRGVGLADQMALLSRGPHSGTVFLPSVDPNGGPNIARIRINGPGMVSDLGQTELGSGSENIPGAIAIQP